MSLNNISFSHEQYEPIEELGRGGMGIVYRCKDRKLQKDVAVKVLAWNLSGAEIIRFHKEAKALAKMQHPNILRIIDCGHSDDDSLFIVLDLLTGQSLSDVLSKETVLPFDEALSVFSQICDGLSHAHQKDILHRDIKPANVFIQRTTGGETRTVITDFGLAKLLTEDQRLTKTGIGLGSPPYMSPEQADGKSVDERSDIYSFGCLMFEALSGERPFSAANIQQLLILHIREPAPRLVDRVPDRNYPDAIDQIIAKCLAKDPSARYQKVSDIKKDLQQLLDSRLPSFAQHSEASGRYAPSADLLKETVQKFTIPKTAGIMGVVIVIAITIAGFWLSFETYTHPDEITIDRTIVPKAFVPTKKEQNKLAQVYPGAAEFEVEKPKPTQINWSDATGKDGKRKLLEICNEQWNSMALTGTHIDYLDASNSSITDADLQAIGFIPLVGIKLMNTKIGDKGFDVFSKILTIQEIYADGTEVTDKGLLKLTKNVRLERMSLSDTAVTDFGVRVLGTMNRLKSVNLSKCKGMKGETLESLQEVGDSLYLGLGSSGIEKKNLRKLASLKNVFNLDVSNLDLRDDDLVTFTKMPNLMMLMINDNPRITRNGFLSLAKIKTLSYLHVRGCPQIKNQDIPEFKKRRGQIMMIIR